uniref:Uncharacterized protein n=1 Tax=Anguilla anguilla TaxID=7936 RepID=A0A0E9UHP6_ANGAN
MLSKRPRALLSLLEYDVTTALYCQAAVEKLKYSVIWRF